MSSQLLIKKPSITTRVVLVMLVCGGLILGFYYLFIPADVEGKDLKLSVEEKGRNVLGNNTVSVIFVNNSDAPVAFDSRSIRFTGRGIIGGPCVVGSHSSFSLVREDPGGMSKRGIALEVTPVSRGCKILWDSQLSDYREWKNPLMKWAFSLGRRKSVEIKTAD